MEQHYKSKIDTWILVLLIAGIALIIISMIPVIRNTGQAGQWPFLIISAASLIFIIWALMGTYYVVDPAILKIYAGPFRWKIPLADIQDVEASRSILSSPALSMDRLRIRYGNNKSILISPDDKQGFIRAIQAGGGSA